MHGKTINVDCFAASLSQVIPALPVSYAKSVSDSVQAGTALASTRCISIQLRFAALYLTYLRLFQQALSIATTGPDPAHLPIWRSHT